MFDSHRRRRHLRNAAPGDGSALPDYQLWQIFHRTLFTLELDDAAGGTEVCTVDVHYFADDLEDRDSDETWTDTEQEGPPPPPVALYRDGLQEKVADPPVAFAVSGGVIEVKMGTYGLSRMHYVPEDGPTRMLRPYPRSLEGLRARFGRRFPRVSRAIGALAVVILLVGLVLMVPQAAELITQVDIVAEHVGTFTSPISLPVWANTALLGAGIVAGLERALTLRNHWLIDADTTWTSFA
ncbi:hypothetical protein [Brachybacterium sacelli]|uniref:Uncharacterized protein n=1 Tax=Brachybacterium sacelli TaxID=173364 RepID=A0ABS4WV98_9MICO|nr:hypothetical protein [Brachybacterium sacelli]